MFANLVKTQKFFNVLKRNNGFAIWLLFPNITFADLRSQYILLLKDPT
jgi:hypothetical protein